MKYLSLIWAQLFRSKTRTLLTLLSVVAAFLLFGLLDSVRVAFNAGASVAGADRLVVASRLSITQMLPLSLERQIAGIDGVRAASYGNWFGGIYQDPKNFFPNFVIGPGYLQLYPEYRIDRAQLEAFEADRTGRGRRRIAGQALWLEDRRHHSAGGDDLPAERRQQQLAGDPARHLRGGGQQAQGRGERAVLPLEVLRRGQCLHERQGRVLRGVTA
jgi:hypothetical protein